MQKKMPKKQTNMRLSDRIKRIIRLGAKAAGLSQAEFTASAVEEHYLKVIQTTQIERDSALKAISNGEQNAQSD